MTPTRLAAWLKPIKGSISHVQLWFLSGDDSRDLLQTWDISLIEEMGIEAFFEDAISACQEDCDENRQMESRYQFIAYQDDKMNSSRVHRAKPSGDKLSDDPLGIGPNGGNTMIGQLVRNNEAFLRMLVQSWGNVMNGYKSLLQEQRAEINAMREREREMQVAIQSAVLKSFEMDEGETRSNIALDKLVKLAEDYLPGVVATAAQAVGEKGIPEV